MDLVVVCYVELKIAPTDIFWPFSLQNTAHRNADGLLRLPTPHTDDSKPCELSTYVTHNVSQVEYFSVTVTQLQKATRQDLVSSKMLQFTK